MKTYQDYEKEVNEKGKTIIQFVRDCIEEYKNSDMYQTAVIADEYARHQNRTILQYQKLLYTLSGNTVPDNFSANFKIPSNHFQRLVKQQVQYLLGNGVTWNDPKTKDVVGTKFDKMLQKAAKIAVVEGASYGFWNLDHLEVFPTRQFAPLKDEENGSIRAGIRFWQIDNTKPLRAVFYEIDGYTNFIFKPGKDGEILDEKRAYIVHTETTAIDDTAIYESGENYPTFPIIPFYANEYQQSEFVGMRESIDCYDLIKSGYANDVDDASQIYWTMQNAGGMNDADIALFLQKLKTLHVAQVEEDGATIDSHTINVPVEAREHMLSLLESDIYKDFMAFDHRTIANGAVNIPQIKAAYSEIDLKANDFEFCVLDFIDGILGVIGIENETPSFTRGVIPNTTEEIGVVLEAANYLTQEYITRKVLTLLGDGDQADDILDEIATASLQSFTQAFQGNPNEQTVENEETDVPGEAE